MRNPTPELIAYRWHRLAMGAEANGTKPPPVHENNPECGWFMRKLVKGGPYVPARIWLESPTNEAGDLTGPEIMRCEVDGKPRDVGSEWTWLCGKPISEDKYMDMLAGNFTSVVATINVTEDTKIEGVHLTIDGEPVQVTMAPKPDSTLF